MKEKLKKIIVMILMINFVMYFFLCNNKVVTANEGTVNYYVYTDLENDLKSNLKRSTYNNLMAGNSNVSSSYDLSKNHTMIVKNQQKVGSCWAFAYSSMIESTIKNNKEYSPMHIEYKTGELFNRDIGTGGNFNLALTYLSSGYGPVYENEFPFENVYDDNNEEGNYLKNLSEVDLSKYSQKARIEDASYFPAIYKTYNDDGTITYKNKGAFNTDFYSTTKTYTEAEVQSIRTLIKQHIQNKGAVVASFYSDIEVYPDGTYGSKSKCYDSVNKSYYNDGKGNFFKTEPNHAVAIVGWDDTYSKENFAEGHKPSKDGAYIVLNSYGSEFGNNGYFYVSYDDFAIEQTTLGISRIKETENSSKTIKYNYQYDELGANNEITATSGLLKRVDTMYGANVFTRQDKAHIENLTEVGVTLLEASGVEVYVNSWSDDLNSSELVASYTGDNALGSGYHVLKLSSPVALTGDKFAVIIKYINSEGTGVPLECNLKNSGIEENNEKLQESYKNAKSNQNESYISINGKEWNDLYNFKAGDTTYKDTNTTIKAFTEQGDEKVSVTGVELNNSSIDIKVGDQTNLIATVKPTNAANKRVTWTSSNPEVATISENGIITAVAVGETTIKVTTQEGNYTAQCKIKVSEKENSDNDIYGSGNGGSNFSSQNANSMANSNLPDTGSKSVWLIILIISLFVIIARSKFKKYKKY